MAHPQLADEVVDETTALEEEYVTVSGGHLPPGYVRRRKQFWEHHKEVLLSVEADAEATSREVRRYRSNCQRLFAFRLRRARSERTALCLSGGGIRSATFSLGVLQWLGQRGLLKQFDFLSTVSGGGYTGSWLTAWIHRHPDGLAGVESDLADGEPAAIVRLREYSNYLAPKFGLLTADTWTLATTYIRNLLINWLAFLPFLAAVITAPQIALAWAARPPASSRETIVALAIGGILLGWVTMVVAFSLPSTSSPRRLSGKRQFLVVDGEKQFLKMAFAPFIGAGIVLTIAWHSARHLTAGELPWFAQFLQSPDWKEWAKAGVVFHVAAMIPAILRVVGGSVLRTSQEIWNIKTGFSLLVLQALLQEGQQRLVKAYGFFFRVLGAVVVCGGVGGALLFAAVHGHDKFLSEETARESLRLVVLIAPAAFWSAIMLAGTLYVALISAFTTDHEREWYARAGAWMLIAIAVWLALTSLSFYGPTHVLWAWHAEVPWPTVLAVVSGFVALSGGSGASSAGKDNRRITPVQAVLSRLPAIAAPIFLAAALSALALGTILLIGRLSLPAGEFTVTSEYIVRVMTTAPWWVFAAAAGVFIAVAAIVDQVVDLGVFSLHALYRDRLVRAYLAASRLIRRPNLFTGIDPNDNLPMVQLRPGSFGQCDLRRLSAFVRQWLNFEWLVRDASHDDETQPEHPVRSLVLRCLLSESAGALWRISRTPPGEALDADDERVLLQRFNAVLADPRLCVQSKVPDDVDPVRFNRRFLEKFEWFDDPVVKEDHTVKRERAHRAADDTKPRLFPVINTALNLVRGDELAWQQRKAESFSITPLHVGAPSLGYRRTIWTKAKKDKAKKDKDEEVLYYGGDSGVSIGTAMTISGAAANPNMGYHSSPAVTFLLTLFNARLGTWLGNLKKSRDASRRAPRRMLPRILAEAFGQTNRRSKFINLSDGGHFENLGVYEMVRRRCHLIVVVDAGEDADYSFEDLGNAINKVRVDLGVSIEFAEKPEMCRLKDGQSAHVAWGTIGYSDAGGGNDGWLLYVKPALTKYVPVDVQAYASQSPKFPHETTSNQFFTERQFESYRMLGWHSLESVAAGVASLDDLREAFGARTPATEPKATVTVPIKEPTLPPVILPNVPPPQMN